MQAPEIVNFDTFEGYRMNLLQYSLFTVLIAISFGGSAVAETLPVSNIAQSEFAYGGAHYGVFEYTDTNSLINSFKLLEKFEFRSDVVETLDLNAYQECYHF
jgi:hypothetical protein